jgi:hypothetical protein
LCEFSGDETIAENEFLDFARAGQGEILDLHPNIRGFLWRYVCAAMRVQRALVERPRAADELLKCQPNLGPLPTRKQSSDSCES